MEMTVQVFNFKECICYRIQVAWAKSLSDIVLLY